MQITDTTHPPAGATALLPASSSEVRDMGWYFLPVVVLSSVIVLGTALVNNIQRRYPVFWIAPSEAKGIIKDPEVRSEETGNSDKIRDTTTGRCED